MTVSSPMTEFSSAAIATATAASSGTTNAASATMGSTSTSKPQQQQQQQSGATLGVAPNYSLVIAAGAYVTVWNALPSSSSGGKHARTFSAVTTATTGSLSSPSSNDANNNNNNKNTTTMSVQDVIWNHNKQVIATCCLNSTEDRKNTTKSTEEDTTVSLLGDSIALFSAETGRCLDTFGGSAKKQPSQKHSHRPIVNPLSVQFGGKSRYLCMACQTGDVLVWDLRKRVEARRFQIPTTIQTTVAVPTTSSSHSMHRSGAAAAASSSYSSSSAMYENSKVQLPNQLQTACLDPTYTFVYALGTAQLSIYRLREAQQVGLVRPTLQMIDNNNNNTNQHAQSAAINAAEWVQQLTCMDVFAESDYSNHNNAYSSSQQSLQPTGAPPNAALSPNSGASASEPHQYVAVGCSTGGRVLIFDVSSFLSSLFSSPRPSSSSNNQASSMIPFITEPLLEWNHIRPSASAGGSSSKRKPTTSSDSPSILQVSFGVNQLLLAVLSTDYFAIYEWDCAKTVYELGLVKATCMSWMASTVGVDYHIETTSKTSVDPTNTTTKEPCHNLVALGFASGVVRIWDWKLGVELASYQTTTTSPIQRVSFGGIGIPVSMTFPTMTSSSTKYRGGTGGKRSSTNPLPSQNEQLWAASVPSYHEDGDDDAKHDPNDDDQRNLVPTTLSTAAGGGGMIGKSQSWDASSAITGPQAYHLAMHSPAEMMGRAGYQNQVVMEEGQGSYFNGTDYSNRAAPPPDIRSSLQQIIQEEVDLVRDEVQTAIRNLHVDMLRQFQIQSEDMHVAFERQWTFLANHAAAASAATRSRVDDPSRSSGQPSLLFQQGQSCDDELMFENTVLREENRLLRQEIEKLLLQQQRQQQQHHHGARK